VEANSYPNSQPKYDPPSSTEGPQESDAQQQPEGQSKQTGLQQLLQDLQNQLNGLADDINQGQTEVATNTARQKQLSNYAKNLERASTELVTAHESSEQALVEADRELAVVQYLIDELESDVRERIEEVRSGLDSEIAAKDSEVETAANELSALELDRAALQSTYDQHKTNLDLAHDAVVQLPAAINNTVASVKQLTKELKAAGVAGQGRKVFVWSLELESAKSALNDLIGEESTRIEERDAAKTVLDGDRSTLDEKDTEITEKQADFDRLTSELESLREKRKTAVKELFVASTKQSSIAHTA